VDHILLHFELEIIDYTSQRDFGNGKHRYTIAEDGYITFTIEVAQYYTKRKKYEISIKYILECLECAVKNNRESYIIKCVGMFEQLRHIATIDAQRKYQYLINEIQGIHEQKNTFIVDIA